MPKIHFTDQALRQLKPHDVTTTYWDASFPSFGIRVGKSAKTFLVIQGGGRRIKIGRYPAKSLHDARRDAHIVIGAAPPPGMKHEEKPIKTADAVDRFLRAKYGQIRFRTHSEYERLLGRHLLPRHGRKHLSAITIADILAITDGLKDTPAEAIHIHAALKTFFRWAATRQLVETSPCAVLPMPFKLSSRSRTLSLAELTTIYRTAQEFPGPFGQILQLCILTGQRRSEVGALKAEYISSDVLTLPPEATKNKTEHTVPLNEAALAILSALPKSGFLFPGRGTEGPFNAWSKSKAAFDKKCGVENWVLHDLRRTFATVHAELGTPPHVVERMLNHISGQVSGVAKIYNRYQYMTEMRAAIERYEAHLVQLCSPK